LDISNIFERLPNALNQLKTLHFSNKHTRITKKPNNHIIND